MENTKTQKGITFFLLSILSLFSLCLVFPVALIGQLIYGVSASDYSIIQMITISMATCFLWGLAGYVIIMSSKVTYGFDILAKQDKMKPWQWIVTFICIIFTLFVSFKIWNGFKFSIVLENMGILEFVFQYIFYGFEIFIFALAIVFCQKAFELWFKNDTLPYVGILFTLIWIITKIASNSSMKDGLMVALWQFIFVSIYLVFNKDFRKTFTFLYFMNIFYL